MSVVSVVCCQVEDSVTSWSLVQRSPTDCGVSLCVISKNFKNEEAIARDWAASAIKKYFFVQNIMFLTAAVYCQNRS